MQMRFLRQQTGSLAVFLLCVATMTTAQASPGSSNASDNLADWSLVCACPKSLSTPHHVVQADDNGRILYYARSGVTGPQLRQRGITATQSQLDLLTHWNLLIEDGETYKTTFPVIDPRQAAALRLKLATLAASITPSIEIDVKDIAEQLRREGFADSSYTIVFSYVLDGLLWEKLLSASELHLFDMTPTHPFWNGAFWAISPKRAGVPGTNDVSEDGIILKMLWTDDTGQALNALGSSTAVRSFLKSVANNKFDSTPIRLTNGTIWELVRANGGLRIPTISGKSGLIQSKGDRIAVRVASVLRHDPTSIAILASIPNASPQTALLIVTHELIWDLIDNLVRDGAVQLPGALSRDTKLTPELLRPLVYLIR
jgi:hypothetical protein